MQFIYITYTFIYITAESEGEKKIENRSTFAEVMGN